MLLILLERLCNRTKPTVKPRSLKKERPPSSCNIKAESLDLLLSQMSRLSNERNDKFTAYSIMDTPLI